MNKDRYGLRSESGQGIIEYILILVVVIAVAMLLATKFFKPFGKWAQFYIGDYVECLLDQGQLPSFGGPSSVQDCTPKEASFTKGGGGGSGGKSGGSGTDDSASQNKKKPAQNEKNASDSKGSSSKDRLVSENGGRMQRVHIGGTDGSDGGMRSRTSIAEAETKDAQKDRFFRVSKFNTGMRVDQGKAQKVFGLSGLLASERDKIKKREEKIQKVLDASGEEARGSRAKKFAVNTSPRKVAVNDVDLNDWSFGKLFRILLIIVIIIALVLFVGGQLVQISKGMEK